MDHKIDFVILWVDPTDPAWQEEYNKYATNTKYAPERFRDWDTLRYLFRGIDKFTPWVNQVVLITCGQTPKWLDVNHPKLRLINHKDYIPTEYLPVFNACAIEFFLHKIPGLSEHFVFLNDDMLFMRPLSPNRFFRNGLPCDMPIESAYKGVNDGFSRVLFNDIAYLNDHYSKREVTKKLFWKWYSLKYTNNLLHNIYFAAFPYFTSFKAFHQAQPYLKSSFEKAVNEFGISMEKRTMTRFRSDNNTNQYVVRYWQLVNGLFSPFNIDKDSRFLTLYDDNIDDICKIVKKNKYSMLCINDSDKISDFERCKNLLIAAMNNILPEKSLFER